MSRAESADIHLDDDLDRVTVRGQVKWFDPAKGYGFLSPADAAGTGDILLHITRLREDGFGEPPEGATVICEAVRRAKGWHAMKVIEVDASTAEPREIAQSAREASAGAALAETAGPFERAIVKWFNRARGYGFVVRPNAPGDVFIHIEVVRRGGMEPPATDDVMEVRCAQGQKGMVAVEARPIAAD